MFISAVLAIATVLLQVRFGLIALNEWQGNEKHWILSVTLPFAAVIGIHVIWRILSTPPKLHAELQSEKNELAAFKRSVEDKEVKLVLARCNRTMTSFGSVGPSGGFQPVEEAECVSVTFANRREVGMPGKIAEGVLAKVTYIDSSRRSFQQDGRWNKLDQPSIRDPRQSQNDLLRITFEPGDEHPLDIAAKFANGCFAMNNDSLREGPQRSERILQGTTVHITVRLVAQYVDQSFDFELRNPVNGQMEIVPL